MQFLVPVKITVLLVILITTSYDPNDKERLCVCPSVGTDFSEMGGPILMKLCMRNLRSKGRGIGQKNFPISRKKVSRFFFTDFFRAERRPKGADRRVISNLDGVNESEFAMMLKN